MITTKQENKLKPIINNYINGNRKDAAQAIRQLNKLEIALLITNLAEIYSFNASDRIKFEDFTITALETK